MKTIAYLFLFVLILVLSGCIYYENCNNTVYATELTIALDRTGSYSLSSPDKQTLKETFALRQDVWKGYRFRLMSFSDVSLNHTYEHKIEPECEYLGNVYKRKKKIAQFTSGLDASLEKLIAEPVERPSSSLYVPLARELNRLAESKAQRKIVVVYSDLEEASPVLVFRTPKTFKLLKDSPDSVERILEKELPLSDLTGIEVYVVFQPSEVNDSEMFRVVSGFYKNMLEKKGAKVTIGANLIIN
jgi:hypothetical protein